MSDVREMATFSVGPMLLGVGVELVQEVIRHQELTPVPLADGGVAGLLNLRGDIVTAVDLRARLHLPPAPDGAERVDVVLRVDGESVALLADAVGDVTRVPAADFEEPPATVDPIRRALILGAHKLPGALLLELDVERAITAGAGSPPSPATAAER